MKSPYSTLLDPRQDRTIFEEEERLITQGYDFLGWNPSQEPRLSHCINEGHNYYSAFPNARKRVEHRTDGKDITDWCTKCRIYWKTDIHL